VLGNLVLCFCFLRFVLYDKIQKEIKFSLSQQFLIGRSFHKKFEGMNVNKITQLLASVDEEDRDKALLTLKTFLSGKETLSKIDFQKLWKGIYYCLFYLFYTYTRLLVGR
jgi:hypothetical protein